MRRRRRRFRRVSQALLGVQMLPNLSASLRALEFARFFKEVGSSSFMESVEIAYIFEEDIRNFDHRCLVEWKLIIDWLLIY